MGGFSSLFVTTDLKIPVSHALSMVLGVWPKCFRGCGLSVL